MLPTATIVVALVAAAFGSSINIASADGPSLAIDMGVTGNSPTATSDVENCASVSRGDRFSADIIVQDVTDLLAWELSLDYDGAVLTVVDHDVKLFQAVNEGSAPVDISARVPDDSGSHSLSAFESSDPLSPDSGSGVLARVTFEATAEGETEIQLGQRDANDDGTLDRGTLLKDVTSEPIGDTSGDGYFDGEATGAIVVVGADCPDGYVVAVAENTGSGDDPQAWPYVAGAVAGVAVLGVVLTMFFFRRRRDPSN